MSSISRAVSKIKKIAKKVKITNKALFEEDFATTLFRTAALLIHAYKNNDNYILEDDDLIHYLCWSPAQVFSKASLRAGVFAWKWVLSIMTTLKLRLVQEITAAWRWTVAAGLLYFIFQCLSIFYWNLILHD
jgi:hypothetical protein